MPKTKVSKDDARAIGERLRDFALRRYESWEEFCRKVGVPRTTGIAWAKKEPSVPEGRSLLELARKTNLNLNWLLLGEGPELREKEATTDRGQLLAAIQAQLRATTDASDDEHEAVWERMLKHSTAILRLAVEGVRPQYREWVKQTRQFQRWRRFSEKWAPRLSKALARDLAEDVDRLVGVDQPRLASIRVVEIDSRGERRSSGSTEKGIERG